MVNKFVFLATLIATLIVISCCDDPYSKNVTLVIPVETGAKNLDTIAIGDSIHYHIDIPKEVQLHESDQRVRLDDFQFGLLFTLDEISDTVPRYPSNPNLYPTVGQLDTFRFSSGVIAYPIRMQETVKNYQFKLIFMPTEVGLYTTTWTSIPEFYQIFDHPFTETCNDSEGRTITILPINNATSEEQFYRLYRSNDIAYLEKLVYYERYASGGSHSFVVIE